MLLAVILAALLLNQAVNSHVALLEERVSVMGMDKIFEGFTVLHISDLHAGRSAATWNCGNLCSRARPFRPW